MHMGSSFSVAKFGGSSMADAVAMQRSAKICVERKTDLIVVSATYGTTNTIIQLCQQASAGEWDTCQPLWQELVQRHRQIGRDLNASEEQLALLEGPLNELETLLKGVNLLRDCSAKIKDSILGMGERLSSILFTVAMNKLLPLPNAFCFDVRTIMATDDRFGAAAPIYPISRVRAKNLLLPQMKGKVIVTQGYIGRTLEGHNTTLGRGGSDFSAAILAEAIDAHGLEIWTDVAGIATTDPRICPKAIPIPEISFDEASELATYGAKIIHPATLAPARRVGIPVYVGSSYEPEKPGTWIRQQTALSPTVRAFAVRKNQVILTISNPKMVQAYGMLAEIFQIFAHHKISIDAITTSEISVAMTINDASFLNKYLLEELSALGEVSVEDNISLIGLVGNNLQHTAGIAKRIFGVLDKINVRMICYGASKHNICILVQNSDAENAIQKLHHEFIE